MLLACCQRSVMSSEISLVQSISPHQRSVMSLTLRLRSLVSRHCLSLSLQASLLQCSLKVFHCTNFSLFVSLTLSQCLSLSLSLSEITEMKWMRVSLSLSLSLFSLRQTLSDSFELWLAEVLTLLIFCLFFDFLNLVLSYSLVLVCVGVGILIFF